MTDQTPAEKKPEPKKPEEPKKGNVRVIVMAQNGVWLGNPPKRHEFGADVEIPADEAKDLAEGLVKVV
jgi:hypothetical protein